MKKHNPAQLAHNPEDIQEFVDVLDAWKTAKRDITKKKQSIACHHAGARLQHAAEHADAIKKTGVERQ